MDSGKPVTDRGPGTDRGPRTEAEANLYREEIDPELMTRFPRAFLDTHAVVPLRIEGGDVVVFGADEGYGAALEIAEICGAELRFQARPPVEIRHFLKERYDRDSSRKEAIAEYEGENVKELEELASDEPLVRMVDEIMRQAVTRRASDIHIEPYENETVIRFRIDGVLAEQDRLPRAVHPAVVSRIKILSRLDIAQNRLPQDGRIKLAVESREIDLRVSTVPTPLGERLVLRVLDRSSVRLDLRRIGMDAGMLEEWDRLIKLPHGIVLVTGPTGSGKTTTLYAALESRRDGKVNMLTVEDPVEYLIEGVGQIQVNAKINLTFAAGLRSILRQDPDIIMVGEIRDPETARIAVQASLTGHMVFSTLHTNDAASAGPRLMDMEIEPYLIGSTLRGVLGQRLVRRLCDHCKVKTPIDHADAMALNLPTGVEVYRAVGCDACDGLGFRGRLGIFELLLIEGEIRELILSGASGTKIAQESHRRGIKTMREDAGSKVLAGWTTPEEVIRASESI